MTTARTTIMLDADIFKSAKICAVEMGVSFSDFAKRAFIEFMKSLDNPKPKAKKKSSLPTAKLKYHKRFKGMELKDIIATVDDEYYAEKFGRR